MGIFFGHTFDLEILIFLYVFYRFNFFLLYFFVFLACGG
jgi:hypothetical protein